MHDDFYQMYLEEMKAITPCTQEENTQLLNDAAAGNEGAKASPVGNWKNQRARNGQKFAARTTRHSCSPCNPEGCCCTGQGRMWMGSVCWEEISSPEKTSLPNR